eukprot:gene2791-12666_t
MLASFELKAAESRLKKDQNARIDREKQRLEKERILKERQRAREQEREEEKARKRQEEQAAEAAAEALREALIDNNRGVFYEEMLQALPLDESAVIAKGIRRFADKVKLPPSAGATLMAQDAPKNGPMLFEVRTAAGSFTHAGLLEFTQAEGTVALPRKVIDKLWGRGQQPQGHVTVTYKFLEKGQFVRFQPLTRGFHEEVGDRIRDVLELAVLGCCTLTEGDLLRVVTSAEDEEERKEYGLRVAELKPGVAVCCMDTDMEAEVVPSEETEQALKEMEETSRRLQAEEAMREEQAEQAIFDAKEAEAEKEERIRQGLEASLPSEVAEGDARPHVTAVFRMPDGSRHKRRFLLEQPLSLLFTYSDAMGAGRLDIGAYSLVTQFPRRVFEPPTSAARAMAVDGAPSADPTLAELGITAGQEMFLLEHRECGMTI